jgi:hypothetical protein
LIETIIDQDSLTLGGTLSGFEFFSQMFDQALKTIKDKNLIGLTIPEKIARIEKLFPKVFDKTIDQSVLTTNQKHADDTVNEFVNKLLYVTKVETTDLQRFSKSYHQKPKGNCDHENDCVEERSILRCNRIFNHSASS